MPRGSFLLSKTKGYTLGSAWDWCVFRLESAPGFFRLLVAFHSGKQEYRAWLALEDGTDAALLARLEYHATLHGWHLHIRTSDIDDVARGVVKESLARERRRDCSGGHDFGITKLNAVPLAFRVFNVRQDDPGGFLQ